MASPDDWFERITVGVGPDCVDLRIPTEADAQGKVTMWRFGMSPAQARIIANRLLLAARGAEKDTNPFQGMTGDLSKFEQPARVQHQEIAPELANNLALSMEED